MLYLIGLILWTILIWHIARKESDEQLKEIMKLVEQYEAEVKAMVNRHDK